MGMDFESKPQSICEAAPKNIMPKKPFHVLLSPRRRLPSLDQFLPASIGRFNLLKTGYLQNIMLLTPANMTLISVTYIENSVRTCRPPIVLQEAVRSYLLQISYGIIESFFNVLLV